MRKMGEGESHVRAAAASLTLWGWDVGRGRLTSLRRPPDLRYARYFKLVDNDDSHMARITRMTNSVANSDDIQGHT